MPGPAPFEWHLTPFSNGYVPAGTPLGVVVDSGTPPPDPFTVWWGGAVGGHTDSGVTFTGETGYTNPGPLFPANTPYATIVAENWPGSIICSPGTWSILASVTDPSNGSYNNGGYYIVTAFTETTPAVTQTSPADGATPSTLTPPLAFSFSDSDPDIWGQFGAYQLQVYRVSDGHLMWDTGMVATTSAQKSARAVTLTYAGSALSSGIQYQWRVRGQNGAGTTGNYTGYRTFTPSNGPDAPTGITPNGLTQTLTPTVRGTYQQGVGGTESAFEYVVSQNGVQLFDSGWVTGTLATGQAYAGTGAAALQWSTAYTITVRSKDNAGAIGPYCAPVPFTTDGPPNAPTMIVPSGGAVVNTSMPTLSWQHNSPNGDAQTKAEILLYDLTAAAWVTGYGPSPKSLSQSTQSHTVTTALTINHQYQLQIRTTGLAAAGAGPYSAATTFTYAAAPNVTMTSPTDGGTITSPSFPVTWTFSGGSGTQQDYRVQVFASDGVTSIYDSGVVAGTALSATVPAGYVHNGDDVFVQLTVRDTLGQSAVLSPVAVSVAFTPPDTLTVTATATGSQP